MASVDPDVSADCHASGAVATFARVAIEDWEPLSLCRHCLQRHGGELFRLRAVVERLGEKVRT